MCEAAGADIRVVDAEPFLPHPRLIDAKIARGTANMAKGPAMTPEQCVRALQLGIDLAETAHKDGIRVLGTGEMGIGNTSKLLGVRIRSKPVTCQQPGLRLKRRLLGAIRTICRSQPATPAALAKNTGRTLFLLP